MWWCRQALFRCQQCGQENWVKNDRGRVEEPNMCPNEICRARFSFRLVHNRSSFSNKQIIKMQASAALGPSDVCSCQLLLLQVL